MKRSPKQWDLNVKPAAGTKLPSGGMIPPYGHIGHWEVTGKVVEEMGFSAAASDILCDASQDPDFYDFGTVPAHAQTPDEADLCGADIEERRKIIDKAVDDYVKWVDQQFNRCTSALRTNNVRVSLYWLGYVLHSIEDLAVHKGITNGEHASTPDNPDYQAADVALSYVYARRMLDAVRDALGQDAFDRLRDYDGDGKLSYFEKLHKAIHPRGWDLDNHLGEYWASGKHYRTIKPPPAPVRWDRELVLSRVLETILTRRVEYMRTVRDSPQAASANPNREFEVLKPVATASEPAKWRVLVYMAGDDRNPRGIEYAISQDLGEIKQVGSTDSVHFVVQTDDATGSASYRYHLRKGTDLAADRIERFNGDLNTGSTKTLVDFVRWAHRTFPAERTALVLWGHGSGHDDQNVYRAVRGSVSPRTAARLARRRLGFFSGTRRSILEQGTTRGYGYDDTARDFLDNTELRKALLQIREILGRSLDVLGFDACLMAMIEVAYQIRDVADTLVASEMTEPGNGWWYNRAFRRLPVNPGILPHDLAKDIVSAYRAAYRDDLTLSAIDLSKIVPLSERMTAWTEAADEADFHLLRRSALDCSPSGSDAGYCDLGTFLDAASDRRYKGSNEAKAAAKALKKAIVAACGRASGLTIYAPGNFRPKQAGSTDALYLSLDFVRESGWGSFLDRVYPPLRRAAPAVESLPIPTPVTGLDRYNARRVLAAVRSGAREEWLDRLRGEVLGPCEKVVTSVAEQLDKVDPPKETIKTPPTRKRGKRPEEERRILILPGIMGSLLHDRSGRLGAVWVDPWNLLYGDDFDAVKLTCDIDWSAEDRTRTAVAPLPLPERVPDADAAVHIEAYGVIPLIYDRMALALMHEFGPVVEFAPYDWRQSICYLGNGLAARIEALTSQYPGIKIALVAHSMGGLVAADALAQLQETDASVLDSVRALVVMGTPFLGSAAALQALRAESNAMHVLKLLGRKSTAEIERTVQTFRGLFDMVPVDQEELLKPGLYAPGPLSRLLPRDARFRAPQCLVRELPESVVSRTRAIVCTTKSTVGTVEVREDGSVDYSDTVAGDGTVSARSALSTDRLIQQSIEVDQGHMTLPLDGQAIEHTIHWIGQQFGLKSTRSSVQSWPAATEIRLPANREELVRHLEGDNELTLGDFVALISLM